MDYRRRNPRPTYSSFAAEHGVDPATLAKHVRAVEETTNAAAVAELPPDVDDVALLRQQAALLVDEHDRLKVKFAIVLRALRELAEVS